MGEYWPNVTQLEARLRESGIPGELRATTRSAPTGTTPPASRTARLLLALGRRPAYAAPRLSLDEVAIRRATPADLPALARLATLDERTVGVGDYLVAEVDGELTAAVSLTDAAERPIAHPFRPSAGIAEHLRQLLESAGLTWSTASSRAPGS
jgi:hypothetical protein